MKSLRLFGENDLRLVEEPRPCPGEGEVLIQSKSIGICGSDVHWWQKAGIGDAALSKPLVLGHEFSALVRSGEQAGGSVAVEPAVNCGSCRYCLEGNPNFCLDLLFAGHDEMDGAFREYLSWPERLLFELPDSLSDAEGAMLEPLGVAIHAADLGHIKPGMRVGVFGCGPIGLLLVQMARIMGATQIIATDKLPHRLGAAREFGATRVIRSFGGSENQEVWKATEGRGVDVAFEAAGENEAVETAIASAKRGAQVVLVGISPDDRTSFQASIARRKGLTIRICRRMKHTYPRAIALVEKGLVDVASLVTHRFSLELYQQAFSLAAQREGLKIVIEIS
ncbi:MAG: zinc-binding dehydrogenase [Anaerolineaceae bacterium]|nr:zinc-binding dehydrogenase [Anaerolineaceae bacterium]